MLISSEQEKNKIKAQSSPGNPNSPTGPLLPGAPGVPVECPFSPLQENARDDHYDITKYTTTHYSLGRTVEIYLYAKKNSPLPPGNPEEPGGPMKPETP